MDSAVPTPIHSRIGSRAAIAVLVFLIAFVGWKLIPPTSPLWVHDLLHPFAALGYALSLGLALTLWQFPKAETKKQWVMAAALVVLPVYLGLMLTYSRLSPVEEAKSEPTGVFVPLCVGGGETLGLLILAIVRYAQQPNLEEPNGELIQLREQTKRLRGDLDQTSKELHRAEEERKGLQLNLEKAVQERNELGEQIKQLRGDLDRVRNELDKAKEEKEELKHKLAAAEQKLLDLRERLKIWEGRDPPSAPPPDIDV